MITIVSIQNPFQPDENIKDLYEYDQTKKLDHYLKHIDFSNPDINFVIGINGVAINIDKINETVVNDNDIIAVCAKTEFTAAAWIAGYAAGALWGSGVMIGSFSTALALGAGTAFVYGATFLAASFVIGYGMNALVSALGPDVPTQPEVLQSEQTYAWNLGSNTFNEGVGIPYGFGTNKVFGQVLNYFTKIKDNDEELYLLLGIFDHEVDSITDIKINDQDYDTFRGVEVDTALGTLTDTAFEGFGDIVTITNINSELVKDSAITTTLQSDQTGHISIFVTAPYGLYYYVGEGREGRSVYLKIESSISGADSWSTMTDTDGNTWDGVAVVSRMRANTTSAYRKSIEFGVTQGLYDIRITRFTNDYEGAKGKTNSFLTAIHERIVDANLSYPGLSKYMIKILATDQLSGGMPKVSCITLKNTVRVWDEELETHAWTDKRATNPAWICWYLLNYYANIPITRLIWEDFNTWADYCDELIPTVDSTSTSVGTNFLTDTTQSWTVDQYIDFILIDSEDTEFTITSNTPTTLTLSGTPAAGTYEISDIENYRFIINVVLYDGDFWTKLQEIARMGRGVVFPRGTRYGVFVDMPNTNVSHLFSMGNIIDGSYKMNYLPITDAANAIEVEYTDPDRNYTRQVVTVYSDDYLTSETESKKANIKINAAVSKEIATREAVFRINYNMLFKRVPTFDAFADSFACIVGDLFYFQHLATDEEIRQGGRVIDAGNDNGSSQPYVQFDQDMTIESGITYGFVIRFDDDTIITKYITSAPTTDDTFVLTESWVDVPDVTEKPPFIFGETFKKKYRITGITRPNDRVRTITGTEYIEEIYTNNDDFVISEPEETTETQAASNVLLVENLILTNNKWYGNFKSNLNVSWTSPASSDISGILSKLFSTAVTIWEIWIEDLTEATDPEKAGEFAQDNGIILHDFLIEGNQYRIYVNISGEGPVNHTSNIATITIQGKAAAPEDITNLALIWEPEHRNIAATWDAVSDIDFGYYELRRGAVWSTATLINTTTDTKMDIPISGNVTDSVTILIKAVDTTGNESDTEDSEAVSVDTADSPDLTPQQPYDENLIGYWSLDEGSGTEAKDSSGNSNDGTITGTSWAQGVSGQCLSFAGGSDIVSFSEITLPHGSWGISFWMIQDTDIRMSIGNNSDAYNRFYHVNSTLTTAYLRIHLNDNNYVDLTFGEIMQDTGWRHIVVTADGDIMSLYLDGNLVDSETELTNEFRVNCIGNPYTGVTHTWEGEIDEVRLYDKSLSAQEAKALYLSPSGLKSPIPGADETSRNSQSISWISESVGSVLPVVNTEADITADNETFSTEADIDVLQTTNAPAAAGSTVGAEFGTNITGGGTGDDQVGNDGLITTITGGTVKTGAIQSINWAAAAGMQIDLDNAEIAIREPDGLVIDSASGIKLTDGGDIEITSANGNNTGRLGFNDYNTTAIGITNSGGYRWDRCYGNSGGTVEHSDIFMDENTVQLRTNYPTDGMKTGMFTSLGLDGFSINWKTPTATTRIISSTYTDSSDNTKLVLYSEGDNTISFQDRSAGALFSLGTDKSDSDKFKLSVGGVLGIDDALEIDSSKNINCYGDVIVTGQVMSLEGVLVLKETTTPSTSTGYGRVYTKADNKLYFQDGAGVEHEVAYV